MQSDRINNDVNLRLIGAILIFLSLSRLAAYGNEVKLRCVADTNVSSFPAERNFNYGQSSRLRLKGVEMLALFAFDNTPIDGWKVERATLYLRYAGGERKLRTLGISTIAAPWQEGTGSAEAKPHEACFAWRTLDSARWAGAQTDFTDVSFTAGNTIASYGDITDRGDGWFSVPVDPRLVQATLAGASYGLAVTDEKGQTRANNDIYSREQSNSAPYLVVEGAPQSAPQMPAKPLKVTMSPDPRHADFRSGAVELTVTPGADTFSYDVGYSQSANSNPEQAPRYVLPLATPGKPQTFHISGLKPDNVLSLELVPVSATGVRGTPWRLIGNTSPTHPQPAPLPQPKAATATVPAPKTPANDAIRVRAYPDTEKADPVTGNLLEEKTTGNEVNAVWDGGKVLLDSARNEFVGFQLLVEALQLPSKPITVTLPARFQSADGKRMMVPKCELFRDWYVKEGNWFPEVCLPLSGPFAIPAADNAVPNQRNQSLTVDLLVPREALPGLYRGTITVTVAGSGPLNVPVELTVNTLTLPDRLGFDISLNTYGTVGGPFGLDDRTPEYRALEREYHRMAHRHRSTLAVLGYSHTGNISTNYAPPLLGKGGALLVSDWSAWDAQFGPYLDGSAFADLPRKGVPVTHLYLPFHEAWPVDIRDHYRYQPTILDYPATITEHALKAGPIEELTDADLANGFVNITRAFAEHIRQKGWTRTDFQFYQNDKHYSKDPKQGGRGTSWWLLDEPNHRDDWLALAYFNRLFVKGRSGTPGVSLPMREDISRPQWQRDYLDGLVDLMVVSGELYQKGPMLRELQERTHMRYWNYGSANAVQRSNLEAEAWAVRAWLAGADAIVPWQSVGDDSNYAHPDETALLMPGKRLGINGPVVSLRLKALRRAQQDAEYLRLLAAAKSWDRAQVAAALRKLLPLETGVDFTQKDSDDAGSYHFGPLRASNFVQMRHAIAESLK